MKRKSGLYDKIISLDNLRQADKIAKRGKLKQYGVRKHLENAETNLNWLHELLNHRKFETSKYSVYEISYPKHRVIARLPYYPDRILQIRNDGNWLWTRDKVNMDKDRALTEIESVLWHKNSADKSTEQIRLKIKEVLSELQTYNHNWGVRQGMFKAINLLTTEVEKTK